MKTYLKKTSFFCAVKDIETSQVIYNANQLIGFDMLEALAFNELEDGKFRWRVLF